MITHIPASYSLVRVHTCMYMNTLQFICLSPSRAMAYQLSVSGKMRMFGSDLSAFVVKPIVEGLSMKGIAAMNTDNLFVHVTEFPKPIKQSSLQVNVSAFEAQIGDLTAAFRGEKTPSLFYYIGQHYSAAHLIMEKLGISSEKLVKIPPIRQFDVKGVTLVTHATVGTRFVRNAVEELLLATCMQINKGVLYCDRAIYNKRFVPENVMYGFLVRQSQFEFVTCVLYVSDPQMPDIFIPRLAMERLACALGGMQFPATLPALPFDPATWPQFLSNGDIVGFTYPYVDVSPSAKRSPAEILGVHTGLVSAAPGQSRSHLTLRALLDAPVMPQHSAPFNAASVSVPMQADALSLMAPVSSHVPSTDPVTAPAEPLQLGEGVFTDLLPVVMDNAPAYFGMEDGACAVPDTGLPMDVSSFIDEFTHSPAFSLADIDNLLAE
jgi:hypothetical protein